MEDTPTEIGKTVCLKLNQQIIYVLIYHTNCQIKICKYICSKNSQFSYLMLKIKHLSVRE